MLYSLTVVVQNKSVQIISLTTACVVHSNVYFLDNIHWIGYLTAVDPLHSTSSAVQTYHHVTSGSVEFPPSISAGKSSFIRKEPVSTNIRGWATSSEVSHADQGIIPFINVLQGHTTVVQVCCTSEWEPNIPCTWWKCMSSWQNHVLINEVYCVPLMSMFIILCPLGIVPWNVQEMYIILGPWLQSLCLWPTWPSGQTGILQWLLTS